MTWNDEEAIEADRKLRMDIGKEASDLLERAGRELIDGDSGDAFHYRIRALQRITALALSLRNGDLS